jgi:hypothetical protein
LNRPPPHVVEVKERPTVVVARAELQTNDVCTTSCVEHAVVAVALEMKAEVAAALQR